MSPPHILLADPHEITREGYMTILRQVFPGARFGQASSFAETQAACEKGAWNLIILEIAMPDGDGADFITQLNHQDNPPRVLVSSSQDESKHGLRLIQGGAAGYVSKAAGIDDLIKGVSAILEGRNYVSPTLAQNLVQYVKPHSQLTSQQILSEREFEVMIKLAEGMSIKEISIQMVLSSKTISTYRARLMQKLGLKSLAELVRYCLDNGIVQQP